MPWTPKTYDPETGTLDASEVEEAKANGWSPADERLPGAPAPLRDPTLDIPRGPEMRPSQGEATAYGLVRGMTGNYADELSGGLSAVGAGLQGQAMGPAYGAERDAWRRAQGLAQGDWPKTTLASQVVGTGVMAPLLPAGPAGAGTLAAAGRAATSGVLGYGIGVGESEAPLGEAALEAIPAAGVGVLGGVAAEALPFLAKYLPRRARDLTLQHEGITRGQLRSVARREGEAVATDEAISDMERVLHERVAKKPGDTAWEKTGAALGQAQEDIGGFFRQADAAAPGTPALTTQDVLDAATAATSGEDVTRLGQSVVGKVWDEAEHLVDGAVARGAGFGETWKWAQQLQQRVYGAGGRRVPEGVDPVLMSKFRQQLVEKLRDNAQAVTPRGAAISPDTFRSQVRDYRALLDLDAATSQGFTREASHQGAFSWLSRHGTEAGAAGVVGSHAMGHGSMWPLVAGAAVAGGAALGRVPAVNRAGGALAGALSTPAAKSVGGALSRTGSSWVTTSLFGHDDKPVGQEQASKDFVSGERSTSYRPPTPPEP